MQIDIAQLTQPNKLVYKILYAAVTPRPIAWVSTVDADGQPNHAPYSFFNAVCSNPPTVMFCPGYRTDPGPKDTLANVRATGEFVVNFVTEDVAAAMNQTAKAVAPSVNEFEVAGLTEAPSVHVRAPRVAESPVQFECKLNQIVTINEEPGGGYIIVGEIVAMHVDDRVWDAENEYFDFEAYNVVGRMAGNLYASTRDRFTLVRPSQNS